MLWTVIAASFLPLINAGTFVDDTGASFEIDSSTTFAVRANYGLSLFHLGVTSANIRAVHGNWIIRGGDVTPEDVVNGFDPEDTLFSALEPTSDDLDFLRSTVNLSPTCFDSPVSCNDIEYEFFDTMVEVDYFLFISNGFAPDGLYANMTSRGIGVIFIDTVTEGGPDCRPAGAPDDTGSAFDELVPVRENCVGRSTIDVINKQIELVTAMNIVLSDETKQEQDDMCDAAEKFKAAAARAHERGVRAMAMTFAVLEQPTVLVRPVLEIQILRTLEELGMPFMHQGLCGPPNPLCAAAGPSFEAFPAGFWFPNCPPGSVDFDSCDDLSTTVYPVDFWLFDTPTYPITLQPELPSLFPDPAILAEQWAYYPITFGALSPESMARYLDYMADRLDLAQPVHPATECTVADTTLDGHLNWATGGLEGGQYACFNENLTQELYCDPDRGIQQITGVPCFSSMNTVDVKDKGIITIDQLRVGDYVRNGHDSYDLVYSLSHFSHNSKSSYLQIHADGLDNPLEISDVHILFIMEQSQIKSVPASSIVAGDILAMAAGMTARVSKVKTVERMGAYAPFTMSGTILTNGAKASSYVTLQNSANFQLHGSGGNGDGVFAAATELSLSSHFVAHVFQAPHRLFCRVFLSACKTEGHTEEGISTFVNPFYQIAQMMLEQLPDLMFRVIFTCVFSVMMAFYVFENAIVFLDPLNLLVFVATLVLGWHLMTGTSGAKKPKITA